MRKVNLIRQHDEKDCGAACLSMILKFYGKKVPLAAVRKAIKVDRDGANIYGVMEGASAYQLSSEAFGGTAEEAWDALAGKEYVLPLMIRVLNDEYEHFAVVCGLAGSRMILLDPDKGKRKVSKEEFHNIFLGEIITFCPTQEFKATDERRSNYVRYVKLIMRQKGLLAVTALISLAIMGIGMAGMYLFRYILDEVVPALAAEELLEESIETLCILIFAVGVMYVLRFGLSLLRAKMMASVSRRLDLPLILGYFNHITSLPLSFLDTMKTGELISRFDDAGKIRDAISGSVIAITLDSLMVIVCGYALYLQSPLLFKAATIIFLAYLVVAAAFVKPIARSNQKLMLQGAEFTSFLKESIDGIETIKATGSENHIRQHGENIYRLLVETGIKNGLIDVRKDSAITLITSVGSLAVLWMGTMQVLEGNITIGTFITFTSLMSCFLDPVQDLVNLQGNIQTAVVAADRLNDIMMLEKERVEGIGFDHGIEEIELSHVDFRYGNRNLVLKDVSFEIMSGQRVALIGKSGCGKSTAAKLVLGLHSPERGSILVNGSEIEDVSSQYLRQQISYVPQTTFLFSDTIRSNLLLGAHGRDVSQEMFERILDICQCQFIKRLPMGIDSVLEENGINLSGGQRQRIAIARALLGSPSVMILDEATSALDAATEQMILDSIRKEFRIMIITITHRLRSVVNYDKIYVLEDGSVSGSGTHLSLLKENTVYSDLWRAQEDSISILA